ncbi:MULTISPECIES: hypothetical protein [unclassified Cupriavidus]|uniref:hypothetical protein n=1 Tax=unclassified Cupriavidus TaxID=2640874 RepID=UPI00048CD8E5|nr:MULTISPECIES: hypothetical protein [unclassified Cupriavidus]MBP0632806.1 hypothetical protein [Cupriavidus sp. AcVe19-1a]MBP0639147.1 hypothetical protein [Cupriavidus sp. AcVe19-6a]
MNPRTITIALLLAACSVPAYASLASDARAFKHNVKAAGKQGGHAVRDAAHAVGRGAKEAGHAVGSATKQGWHATKKAVKGSD